MSYMPCKGCEKRAEGCHVKCKDYDKFKKENERIKKNRKKEAISRSTILRANKYN